MRKTSGRLAATPLRMGPTIWLGVSEASCSLSAGLVGTGGVEIAVAGEVEELGVAGPQRVGDLGDPVEPARRRS
ncbi:MAG: hypothetical protein V9H69_24605 [Anaerolineae bacterium]